MPIEFGDRTFEDFDGCVTAMSDEENIDDPEAFCGWLEENSEKASKANRIWTDIKDLSEVAVVETPSDNSERLIMKSVDQKDKEKSDELLIKSDEKQILYAPAMTPSVDKDGDLKTPNAIEKAAHKYMKNQKENIFGSSTINLQHTNKKVDADVVESWILKKDRKFENIEGEEKEYEKGTWLLGAKFEDSEVWKDLKNGNLRGWSIEAELENDDYIEKQKYKGDEFEIENMEESEIRSIVKEEVESVFEKSEEVQKAMSLDELAELADKEKKEIVQMVLGGSKKEKETEEKEEEQKADKRELAAKLGDLYDMSAGDVMDVLDQVAQEGDEEDEQESYDEDEDEKKETEEDTEEKSVDETPAGKEKTEETSKKVTAKNLKR